jgi:hypothetical protein
MWLRDCSDEEKLTLMAIASLAASLPRSLAEYAEAIYDINRKYFTAKKMGNMLSDHNPVGRSLGRPRRK